MATPEPSQRGFGIVDPVHRAQESLQDVWDVSLGMGEAVLTWMLHWSLFWLFWLSVAAVVAVGSFLLYLFSYLWLMPTMAYERPLYFDYR